MTKSRQMLEIEEREGRDIRAVLRDAYAEGGGVVGAAALLGISVATFSTWVSLLGGEIRSAVEFSEWAEATA